jgi:hypothetical protein
MLCVHRISVDWQCPGVQVCCEVREVEEVTPAREPPSPGPTELPPPGPCGVRGGSLNPAWFRMFSVDNFLQYGVFPWLVSLLRNENKMNGSTLSYKPSCGASLIHPQVALTGANCLNRYLVHVLPTLLSLCLSVCCLNERI